MSHNEAMGTSPRADSRAPAGQAPGGAIPGARRAAGLVVDEFAAGAPAAGLRAFISGYWGFRQAGVAPAEHIGLPSPFLTLIFTLDDPLVVAGHPDPAQPGDSYATLVGGLHAAPALITHDGRQSGVQVALSPLGARALLGLPAGELASLDVEGADVLGPLAARIQDRLRGCATWPERFAALNELLLARAYGDGGPAVVSPEIGYAWRRLLCSGGQESVARLAAETGWSDRHLRSQFRQEVGLAPKAAARVVRFDRARRLLARQVRAGGPARLAELAASTGYYDQAHLDRDFAALAGVAPSVWLAREFRNVQAVPDLLLGS
jgi:AraC-like DNA-binding protein